MATFLIAAGGTGGHVMPGLAVARELKRLGHECIFIGTPRGAEARLVPAAGFNVEWIDIAGLQRKRPLEMLSALAKLPLAALRVRGLISQHRPAALLSIGGYVAGPAVLAAFSKGIPVVAVEPNAVPGLVTRKTANRIARACVNFEETLRWFPAGCATVTGVPVRNEFFEIAPKTSGEFTVLITGGSQGSRTLNRAARESWPLLQAGATPVRMLLQCGKAEAESLQREFAATGLAGSVTAFVDDIPAAFAQADLIIARAGAATVAELCASGKPSILVPFPYAADDHQTRNAEAMVRAEAARMYADRDWTGEALVRELTLLAGSDKLLHMGHAARRLAKPNAAAITARILLEVANLH